MTRSNSHWIPLTTLACAATLAACGGSSPASTSTPTASASTPTAALPTTTAAAAACPSGGTVGSALGIALPSPVGVAGGGSTPLPPGATDINCDYHGTSDNVIISILQNIPASYISQFSSHFPVAFKPVSGVGDEARAFTQALGAGKNNQGLVAAKGSTVVALIATYTPATLSQIEALVNSLL